MNIKLNLVLARGRHARLADRNVRLAVIEAFTIALFLTGIYFAVCALPL